MKRDVEHILLLLRIFKPGEYEVYAVPWVVVVDLVVGGGDRRKGGGRC